MARKRVLSVVGSRPEVIKMAPVVRALESDPDLESLVVTTAQHREMSRQFLAELRIEPDADLDIMRERQSLVDIVAAVSGRFEPALGRLRPDLVLVQGDTSTAAICGLLSFYCRVPVGHVEAGLRTQDLHAPFPEELNRQLISRFAVLNFAPTAHAESNLLAENVAPETIHRVGNTVVDAVQMLAHTPGEAPLQRTESGDKRLIVVTAHRRENHGAPLERICDALRRIAEAFPDVRIVFPVHPNPAVRDVVHARLGAVPGIELIEPLPYGEFLRLVARCTLALTDSGGLQEEAPSLNKPVVVLREATERPELVAAGGARLVGSDIERIVSAVAGLLNDPAKLSAMTGIQNPFGDGQAARRIHETIRGRFGLPVPTPLGPYRPPPPVTA